MNTIEIENIAKEIISLANELNNEFNNLFNRFHEVPNITREWVGQQAQFYFDRVALDKKQYVDFANDLKNIGYKLNTDITETESCIKRNLNEEAERGN